MKKFNLKSLFAAVLVLVFSFSGIASAAPQKTTAKKTVSNKYNYPAPVDNNYTTSGFTGLITLPSAEAAAGGNGFGVGMNSIADLHGRMTELLTMNSKIFDCLEVAVQAGLPLASANKLNIKGGIKWNFWGNEYLKLSLLMDAVLTQKMKDDVPAGGTSLTDKNYLNAQALFLASWIFGNLETTTAIGTSYGTGDDNGASLIDLGFGFRWWFLNTKNNTFSMALVTDFTSYDTRYGVVKAYDPSAYQTGDEGDPLKKGNASTSLRMGFMNRAIIMDVGAMDFLNDGMSFFLNLSFTKNY